MRMTAERWGAPRASAARGAGTAELPWTIDGASIPVNAADEMSGAVLGTEDESPVRCPACMLQTARMAAGVRVSQCFVTSFGAQPWSAMGAAVARIASHGATAQVEANAVPAESTSTSAATIAMVRTRLKRISPTRTNRTTPQ